MLNLQLGDGPNQLLPVCGRDVGRGAPHCLITRWAMLEAFDEMPVRPPMVVSLAKREEEIYIQAPEPRASARAKPTPVRLPRNNAALRLLQSMRDEAHRFAQHYHHMLRKKKTFEQDSNTNRKSRRRPS